MKIRFLGTAAAEGVPAISCSCRVCKESRQKGGKNIRSRSQALINGDLLIDYNADTFWHSNTYGVDLAEIDDCIITHSHEDHLYCDEMYNYRPDFCHGRTNVMNFYSAQSGYQMIKQVADNECMKGFVVPHLVEAYTPFTVCNGKYDVLPLEANHSQSSSPLIYSISDGTKKLLYAHDTGWLNDNAWAALKARGYHDLVTIDCTGGIGLNGEWINGHMTLGTVLRMLDEMKAIGVIDGKTITIINHFSHNGGQNYDELCKYVKENVDSYDLIVSYDGMTVGF